MNGFPIGFHSGPFWSALPPLPLRGVATPLVESVHHYASRLAWVAGTTVRRIVAVSVAMGGAGSLKVDGASSFCGPGKVYKTRVENLEALTGIGTIRCGSLYVLDAILTRKAMGRDTTFHRWCPECYAEWDDSTSWEPLVWSIELQASCPIHGCDLEERCRHCGTKLTPNESYTLRRRCNRCRNSLAGVGVRSPKSNYAIWVERQLSGLLAFCATPGRGTVPETLYETFAKEARRTSGQASDRSIAAKRLVTQLLNVSTYHRNEREPHIRVSLRKLINVCALHGVSVEKLLESPEECASQPLLSRWGSYCPLKPVFKCDPDKASVLADCLETFMAKCGDLYLPDPTSTMREMGLAKRQMVGLRGETYQAYMERRAKQGSAKRLSALEKIFVEALTCVTTVRPNPFAHSDIKVARMAIVKLTGVSRAEAMRMAKCAVLWRKVLELSKARTLGMSKQEIRAHKKFGGIADEWR